MAIWDYFKPTSSAAAEPLSPLSDAHRERAKLFGLLWDYYRGKHRKPLVVKAGQADDNVILNYSRRAVDLGVGFLFGPGVEFALEGGSDDEDPAEAWLARCWGTAEQKQRTLLDLGMNGAVTGTPFVRLYAPAQPGDLPRVAPINPALMDVMANADDMDDIVAFTMTWRAGREWKRQRADRQPNGEWGIATQRWVRGEQWETVDEEAWPHQFAPFLYCQNLPHPNEIWGISDLEEADINDAINWTASNINRILRFHSHPKTIGTGFNAAQLQTTAADQFWTIPTADAKVWNLEMQSDLGSAYAMLQELKRTFGDVTGIPDLDPEKVNVGALSGFALRILYGPLLLRTDVKHVTYGALLASINRALLEFGGFAGEVVNVWGDPLPANDVEQVQALTQDRANGLSTQTYLERRGYDAEKEMQRIEDERNSQGSIGEALLRAFETGQ